MNEEPQKRVGVLFDVENILFSAVNDRDLIGHNANLVLRASLVAIEKVARNFGLVVTRIGALSLPRANTRESIAHLAQRITARRDRLTFAQILVDSGYEIALVSEGQHAADNSLCRIGPVITEDLDVIVVVTGDGEEPFTTLFGTLLITTKQVHVVSYQYIPRKIKYRKGISYTHCAPIIRELLNGDGEPEEFVKEQERKVAVTPENAEASLHKKLRQSVKTFSRRDVAKIDPEHLSWIKSTVLSLKAYFVQHKAEHARYHELLNFVVSTLPIWPGQRPTVNAVKVLVSALSATELFERTEVYVPNDVSALWTTADPTEGN